MYRAKFSIFLICVFSLIFLVGLCSSLLIFFGSSPSRSFSCLLYSLYFFLLYFFDLWSNNSYLLPSVVFVLFSFVCLVPWAVKLGCWLERGGGALLHLKPRHAEKNGTQALLFPQFTALTWYFVLFLQTCTLLIKPKFKVLNFKS